jgi:antirestriction protein
MKDLEGMGGDEKWEGVWYPVTLIRDSYFRDYAEELAADIGMIAVDVSWPNNCIDWDRAARELRMDYSSVEFDNVTYWTR